MFFIFNSVVGVWVFSSYRWLNEALMQMTLPIVKVLGANNAPVFEHLCEDIDCFGTQAEQVGHCLNFRKGRCEHPYEVGFSISFHTQCTELSLLLDKNRGDRFYFYIQLVYTIHKSCQGIYA